MGVGVAVGGRAAVGPVVAAFAAGRPGEGALLRGESLDGGLLLAGSDGDICVYVCNLV